MELINRRALLKGSIRIEGRFSLASGRVQPFEAIPVQVIEAAPTVDAVLVVQCGDCRYYDGHKCSNAYVPSFPDRKPRDFCSHGKRAKMDGGADDEKIDN